MLIVMLLHAGLPRLLDPFRSNRVFSNNVLAWRDNSACSPAAVCVTPSVQMVRILSLTVSAQL